METLEIASLPFIRQYLERAFSGRTIKSVTPYAFTVGSNFQNEGLTYNEGTDKAVFYGHLYLSINPNSNDLQPERIQIKYRSYLHHRPFIKTITRFVEKENLINEASQTLELFDSLEVTQQSTRYDFYFTFLGYKIDFV